VQLLKQLCGPAAGAAACSNSSSGSVHSLGAACPAARPQPPTTRRPAATPVTAASAAVASAAGVGSAAAEEAEVPLPAGFNLVNEAKKGVARLMQEWPGRVSAATSPEHQSADELVSVVVGMVLRADAAAKVTVFSQDHDMLQLVPDRPSHNVRVCNFDFPAPVDRASQPGWAKGEACTRLLALTGKKGHKVPDMSRALEPSQPADAATQAAARKRRLGSSASSLSGRGSTPSSSSSSSDEGAWTKAAGMLQGKLALPVLASHPQLLHWFIYNRGGAQLLDIFFQRQLLLNINLASPLSVITKQRLRSTIKAAREGLSRLRMAPVSTPPAAPCSSHPQQPPATQHQLRRPPQVLALQPSTRAHKRLRVQGPGQCAIGHSSYNASSMQALQAPPPSPPLPRHKQHPRQQCAAKPQAQDPVRYVANQATGSAATHVRCVPGLYIGMAARTARVSE
jgi:hypothetical protein